MDKFSKVVTSLKGFDTSQVANDKVVVCLALIGLASTIRMVWNPLAGYYSYYTRKRLNLKLKYGGEWALITGHSDEITHDLAIELAREGFNIILVCKKNSPADTGSSQI